jgi:hypothetical protein
MPLRSSEKVSYTKWGECGRSSVEFLRQIDKQGLKKSLLARRESVKKFLVVSECVCARMHALHTGYHSAFDCQA